MKKDMINPISLKGQDKLNRIHELMGKINPVINENVSNSVLEIYHKGADGKNYGIVRENYKYYIKIAEDKNNLTVKDFQYIGGLKNKNDYVFESYAKAVKHLKLKLMSLDEAYGIEHDYDNNVLMKEGAFSYGFKTEEETNEMLENEYVEEDDSDKIVDKADYTKHKKESDTDDFDDTIKLNDAQKSKIKDKLQKKFDLTEEEANYLVDEILSCETCYNSVKEGYDDEEYGDEDYERASREQQYYGRSPEAGALDEKKKL